MGKINWVRVILGGVVAGMIINIFEHLLNGVNLARPPVSAHPKQTGYRTARPAKRRVAGTVPDIGICPGLDQKLDYLDILSFGSNGEHQWCHATIGAMKR